MPQVSRGDLIAASKADNVSLVKALLAAGADKNEKDTVRGSEGIKGRNYEKKIKI